MVDQLPRAEGTGDAAPLVERLREGSWSEAECAVMEQTMREAADCIEQLVAALRGALVANNRVLPSRDEPAWVSEARVAILSAEGIGSAEAEAKARLIAAAPELLAALKAAVVAGIIDIDDEPLRARAAIEELIRRHEQITAGEEETH